ncbi:1-acyl-sn-glycerol-3-phosphate acyltransferase [Robiginitalea sp. IMCC43444]|uniref:1-acyl-sn-glycerol-3-phosphate acyltransferase n=1 Tax=Robiginitalea sp. IMCC43444 TaxID=3459121 RepID=UPI004042D79C
MIYALLKILVRFGFFCYYREVRWEGLENIPADKPVMLLPNHQNALLDPLLYAAYAPAARPWFLTRADVFTRPWLKRFFKMLHMIPIYRFRDGRENLKYNEGIFDSCADLFRENAQLLLFPEANHNLRRQVRPLSKGFTRILQASLEKYPDLDIRIVPVGINYQQAAGFPDSVCFRFGKQIAVSDYFANQEDSHWVPLLKEAVFSSLTRLTTHIPPEADYEQVAASLHEFQADFLQPEAVNYFILDKQTEPPRRRNAWSRLHRILHPFFTISNLPVLLGWKWFAANKVWEPEFLSTFRFGYAFLIYPLYFTLLGITLFFLAGAGYALAGVLLLFLFNLLYVKTGQAAT